MPWEKTTAIGLAGWLATSAVFCPMAARADEFSDNFSANLDRPHLNALARDLGALVGGGTFHSGRGLAFPIGFDLGAHVVATTVDEADSILRDDGPVMSAEWLQGELGMPRNFNLMVRYGQIAQADGWGGGVRYGLIPGGEGLFSLAISGLYTAVHHEFFTAGTATANVVLGWDLPVIRPYLGVGLDHTRLRASGSATALAADAATGGRAGGYRVEAGINVSVVPFTYLTLAAGVANGGEHYHGGLGLRF